MLINESGALPIITTHDDPKICSPNASTIQTIAIQNIMPVLSHTMSSRGPVTNGSHPTVMATGMHYPQTTKSITVDGHYTASAGQSSGAASNKQPIT